MPTRSHTPEGAAATDVILSTFRANGLLLEAGDRLTAPFDLSASRWQALGAVALGERPLTVPQIARRMGLTRQSVHATVRRLVADGLVELTANADHRRSPLVTLTPAGREAYDQLDARQITWANELSSGLRREDLEVAARVLAELSRRLEEASAR